MGLGGNEMDQGKLQIHIHRIMQSLYYPVMIEDTSSWSDEIERNTFCRTMLSTADFVTARNKASHRREFPCRVIPGSVERLNNIEMSYRESHIYYRVCRKECEILAAVGEGKVWHERYRMTAVERAMIADNLVQELQWSFGKPWQIPVAYEIDGANIVLIRSEKAEEYMKENLCEYCYKDGELFCRGKKIIDIIN